MAGTARGRRAGAQQLGAAAGRPADVQPGEAPGRGRDPADGRGQRHRRHSLQPGRGRPALGQVFWRGLGTPEEQQDVRGTLRRSVDGRGRREVRRLLQAEGPASGQHRDRLGGRASGGHCPHHRRAQCRPTEGLARRAEGEHDAGAARRDRRPLPHAAAGHRSIGRAEGCEELVDGGDAHRGKGSPQSPALSIRRLPTAIRSPRHCSPTWARPPCGHVAPSRSRHSGVSAVIAA